MGMTKDMNQVNQDLKDDMLKVVYPIFSEAKGWTTPIQAIKLDQSVTINRRFIPEGESDKTVVKIGNMNQSTVEVFMWWEKNVDGMFIVCVSSKTGHRQHRLTSSDEEIITLCLCPLLTAIDNTCKCSGVVLTWDDPKDVVSDLANKGGVKYNFHSVDKNGCRVYHMKALGYDYYLYKTRSDWRLSADLGSEYHGYLSNVTSSVTPPVKGWRWREWKSGDYTSWTSDDSITLKLC